MQAGALLHIEALLRMLQTTPLSGNIGTGPIFPLRERGIARDGTHSKRPILRLRKSGKMGPVPIFPRRTELGRLRGEKLARPRRLLRFPGR